MAGVALAKPQAAAGRPGNDSLDTPRSRRSQCGLVSPTLVRIVGLIGTACYAAFIVWLHAQQPRTIAEVSGAMGSSLGVYEIDAVAFADGLRFFRADRFAEARAALGRADPAGRDARTQFYVAYTCYRQGWGRLYHDDALYRLGMEHAERAIALAPDGRLVVDDETLGLRSADELRAELERGLTREWSDLNPLKVLRERQ